MKKWIAIAFVLIESPALAANVGYTALAPITPPVGTGNTYYVSDPSNPVLDAANRALLPNGATVYNTIQAASDATNPGDTVEVMNGYYEALTTTFNNVLKVTRSGSASGGYITYMAYPGMHPVITAQNSVYTYDVVAGTASYIVFEGFEIAGQAPLLSLGYASANSAQEAALQITNAAAANGGTYPPSESKALTSGSCIYWMPATHVYFLNNLIHDCSAAGINLQYVDYTTIEANTVYNTSWYTMFDTSGIAIHYGQNTDTATIYKNYILDNLTYGNANTQFDEGNAYTNAFNHLPQPTPTDGNGIIVDTLLTTNDGNPYTGRTLVAGNISYGNGGSGIHAYASSNVDIINNTLYMNETCPVAGSYCGPVGGLNIGQLREDNSTGGNMWNNISYAAPGRFAAATRYNTAPALTEGGNVFSVAGNAGVFNLFTPAASDKSTNPMFVNAAGGNFALQPGSPAIGAGTPWNYDGVNLATLLPQLAVVNNHVNAGAVP